ncbi:GNAT family N-acetyltransferase [Streptacidiphilus monticola]
MGESDAAAPVGFVSGVEVTHPDKGTEMFLYELAVAEAHRRRGVGRALVEALAELARQRGCYGMWVLTDRGNPAALAAYRSAGAAEEEDCVLLNWSFPDPVDRAAARPPTFSRSGRCGRGPRRRSRASRGCRRCAVSGSG